MPEVFLKDPDAVLDYVNNWETFLQGVSPEDTIATSAWVADTGLTVDSDTNSTTRARVWLSGGTAGQRYKVVNTVVTAGGRTADWTLYIRVQNR